MGDAQGLVEHLLEERGAQLTSYAALLADDDSKAGALVDDSLVAVMSGRRPPHDAASLEEAVRAAIPVRALAQTGRRDATSRPQPSVPAIGTEEPEAGLEVRRALRVLSPRERVCMVMRHHDGLTVIEIGHALSLSQQAVREALQRATALVAPVLGVDDPGMEPETVQLRPAGGRG